MSQPDSRSERRVSTEGSGATLEELLADAENPFLQLDTPMTAYEWLKAVLNVPFFIYRLILIMLILPFVWLWAYLFTQRVRINTPMSRWRYELLIPVLCFWGRVLLFLGFHCNPRVRGRENLKKAEDVRSILIYNHVSYLDALIIQVFLAPSGLAKSGVASLPFFGRATRAFQFLFVRRVGTLDPPIQGIHAPHGNTQLIKDRSADKRYPLFAMGPEGTTKHSNYMLQFSTGAFVAGRPVSPVLLRYECKYFNVGWGICGNDFWHFYRMQSQFSNPCTIEILPPYIPSKAEQADPRLFADNVRRHMAKHLGVKLSPYGIPEQQLLKKAKYSVDWTGSTIVQKQSDGTFKSIRRKIA